MFFKIFLYYILGYVNISVEGYFIERFINICISKNVLVWNIRRKKSSFLYANIGLKDFKKIKEIAKITKCRIKIQNKKGLPFLLNKYKKRKIFAISLAVILLLIFGTSNFVWNIEVIGNNTINTSEIIENLNENGLKIGMLKQKLVPKDIINNIRLKRNDIAWIGIDTKGTNVIVSIVEADKKPEIIDENEYCNIVTKKDGIITKINVQNGTALVKEGDIVKNGNILVGGWLEGKYTGTRYVHAKANVEAKVWYSKKDTIKLKQAKKEETGSIQNCYGININNLKINFTKTLPKFQNYDTISENKKLKIFSNFYFPIEFCKTTYVEYQNKEVTYEIDEAKQILQSRLEEDLKKEIENQENIVNKQVNYIEENEEITVEVIYEVIENIGTNEKI